MQSLTRFLDHLSYKVFGANAEDETARCCGCLAAQLTDLAQDRRQSRLVVEKLKIIPGPLHTKVKVCQIEVRIMHCLVFQLQQVFPCMQQIIKIVQFCRTLLVTRFWCEHLGIWILGNPDIISLRMLIQF